MAVELVEASCFPGLSPEEKAQQIYLALYTPAADESLVDPACFPGLSQEERREAIYLAAAVVGGVEVQCFRGLSAHEQGALLYTALGGSECFGDLKHETDQLLFAAVYALGGGTVDPDSYLCLSPWEREQAFFGALLAISGGVPCGAGINVAWFDQSGNEDGFRVYYGTDGITFPNTVETGPNVQDVDICQLIDGQKYYFYVVSFNEAGESDPTEIDYAYAGTQPTFVQATGGTITEDGHFKVHSFYITEPFDVTVGGDVDYFVGAAGGGGGIAIASTATPGGGGGSGGIREGTKTVAPGTLAVVIGAGGDTGSVGGNSSFDDIISVGGGYGARAFQAASIGGSGGGGASGNPTGATGTAGQGNNGGNSANGSGGGGGKGAIGSNASGIHGGAGGAGGVSSITGISVTYGGGGGGGASGVGVGGAGGVGGGGSGGTEGADNATAGSANSCGGGGGAGGTFGGISIDGGAGGSGKVVVRYEYR